MRARGYSLVEVLMAIALSAILGIGAVSAGISIYRQGEMNRAVEELQAISVTANANGMRVTATTPGATPGTPWTYTFGGRSTTWTGVGTLNTTFGTGLPVTSPYGTAYEYRSNGQQASARFVIPDADLARVQVPVPAVITTSGGSSFVEVSTLLEPGPPGSRRLRQIKRDWYREQVR